MLAAVDVNRRAIQIRDLESAVAGEIAFIDGRTIGHVKGNDATDEQGYDLYGISYALQLCSLGR